jgi:hypothetical protein
VTDPATDTTGSQPDEHEIVALVETCVGRWAAGGPDAVDALDPLADLTCDPAAAQLAVVVLAERLCNLLGVAAAHLDDDAFALWSQATARFHDPETGELLSIST